MSVIASAAMGSISGSNREHGHHGLAHHSHDEKARVCPKRPRALCRRIHGGQIMPPTGCWCVCHGGVHQNLLRRYCLDGLGTSTAHFCLCPVRARARRKKRVEGMQGQTGVAGAPDGLHFLLPLALITALLLWNYLRCCGRSGQGRYFWPACYVAIRASACSSCSPAYAKARCWRCPFLYCAVAG